MDTELRVLIDFADNIISETCSLRQALEQLDKVSVKTLFAVDHNNVLAGTLTDGDIRRAILGGAFIDTPVSQIANHSPVYLERDGRETARSIMGEKGLTALPVVDDQKRILKIYVKELEENESVPVKLGVPVVIMAGGLGTRLYPYTKILPKPLIPVSDKPISERIIESFKKAGCEEFHMIVNYKKNMIKAYFNDNDCGDHVYFWDEDTPLGTGGGLELLRDNIRGTFILTNCDILILEHVKKIVEHHRHNANKATMVCSLKNFEIPYGIVNFTEGGEISSLEEKPKMSFFTNTGYYVLEPEVFRYIRQCEKIDMPEIIESMRLDGQ